MILATRTNMENDTMSNRDTSIRKDQIIVTEDMIGREVFFGAFPDMSDYIHYTFTPNKRYRVEKTTETGGVYIRTNDDQLICILINHPCAHLDCVTYWKLAARTSSKQNLVSTVSGRKI